MDVLNQENLRHSQAFIENYKDSLPSLSLIRKAIEDGHNLSCSELRKIRPDLAKYIDNLVIRLCNNDYAKSIKAYKYNESIILSGYDERENQLSNYAIVKGNEIFCWSGNSKGDGHLNEFINNTRGGLVPNSKYHLENATYVTDYLGRVIDVYEHHITKRPINRNHSHSSMKSLSDEKDGRSTDVGGHIVAHNIDGASEAINIIAMDGGFNNEGEWKSMELEILNAYQNNVDCLVHKHLRYNSNSQRPSHIDIEYEIEGKTTKRSFDLP